MTVVKRDVPMMVKHQPNQRAGRYFCETTTVTPATMEAGEIAAKPSICTPDVSGEEPLHAWK